MKGSDSYHCRSFLHEEFPGHRAGEGMAREDPELKRRS